MNLKNKLFTSSKEITFFGSFVLSNLICAYIVMNGASLAFLLIWEKTNGSLLGIQGPTTKSCPLIGKDMSEAKKKLLRKLRQGRSNDTWGVYEETWVQQAWGIYKHDFQFWIMSMLLESVILTCCQIWDFKPCSHQFYIIPISFVDGGSYETK